MKSSFFLAALLMVGSVVAQDKAALKRISAVFESIEQNYESWPCHSYSAQGLEGGFAFEHHVWKS